MQANCFEHDHKKRKKVLTIFCKHFDADIAKSRDLCPRRHRDDEIFLAEILLDVNLSKIGGFLWLQRSLADAHISFFIKSMLLKNKDWRALIVT